MSTVTYTIDANDCLLAMGGDWDEFADRNGSPECFAEELIGTNLFDAIADDMTAKLYRTIFSQVRAVNKPFSMPFRCDGDGVRREMHMTVTPLAHGHLSIVSVMVREVAESDRPACQNVAQSTLIRCSACNKLLIHGAWIDLRDAVQRGLCAPEGQNLAVSYGICEPCRQAVHQKLLGKQGQDIGDLDSVMH
jgi:hypothetical protein